MTSQKQTSIVRHVAERITDRLLQLRDKDGRDLGGYCRDAIVNEIERGITNMLKSMTLAYDDKGVVK